MGIVNVTADSFSDGGAYLRTEDAIRHARMLAAQGADIIDVGGESTRPGAPRVPVEVELENVVPVIRELASAGLAVSVDTTRSRVADRALSVGAVVVNDVSGGLADPAMAACVASSGAAYVAMHWRAPSAQMRGHAQYDDVVRDVVTELERRLDALVASGVDAERIVLDPGLGFAKRAEHDWRLLTALDELGRLGRPILVGASRKSFLVDVLADLPGPMPPPRERDPASVAVAALAAASGAYCVRVHDVRSTLQAVAVAASWSRAATKSAATLLP
ncbi:MULTISPECIES: dihydropteroate synthase [unclassified Mycobacterium]|uniref:dihydropteroate synthase n=1 Tax=unclassified Mycobacterium TaxID=2642494 RepID=UPI0029C61C83|nr:MULTISPECIES: dihydropteroate synthase [unclassified Mycobacterium]